jgi:hypothetical protein
MLAGVEPAASPAHPAAPAALDETLRPQASVAGSTPAPRHLLPWRLILTLVAIVVFLGAAGFVAYTFRIQIFGGGGGAVATPPDAAAPAPPETPPPAPPPLVLDADADGILDQGEAELGTDPQNPDTDGDGLFDGEEANAYHTNPLSSDTDGDGYADGDEVRAGYDPNGPGRLFNVPPAAP